jgi:hypothetical protein
MGHVVQEELYAAVKAAWSEVVLVTAAAAASTPIPRAHRAAPVPRLNSSSVCSQFQDDQELMLSDTTARGEPGKQ